jgi:hypothetical protein
VGPPGRAVSLPTAAGLFPSAIWTRIGQ